MKHARRARGPNARLDEGRVRGMVCKFWNIGPFGVLEKRNNLVQEKIISQALVSFMPPRYECTD